jgi:TolB-like protein
MLRTTRMFVAAAALAVPTFAVAQDNRPVVVVFTFQNSAMGAGRADFDGIATAVQDLLITDLASNAKIRLVDRARIAEIMQEQNLVKGGSIDAATAIRLGKMMGAQYAITGGWTSVGGKAVLTGRTIDMETSQIANPEKIEGKSDDVFGLITQLSSKLSSGMTLAPKPGRRVGDAGEAPKQAAPAQSGSPAASKPAASAAASDVERFAKPVAKMTKLDGATLKLYSNALDEMDKKNKAKAKELLKQVLAKYETFEPAQRLLDKLS